MLEELGDIDLMAPEDTSGSVARAALEGVLSGKDLLAVGRLLEVLRRAHSSFGSVRGAAPTLAEMAGGIPELADVERRIRSSIDERGEGALSKSRANRSCWAKIAAALVSPSRSTRLVESTRSVSSNVVTTVLAASSG